MEMAAAYTSEELGRFGIPVIVEAWEKVKESGSKRRKFLAEFTETERRVLGQLYPRFYKWYLVTGFPQEAFLKVRHVTLIQRAVNFFASI